MDGQVGQLFVAERATVAKDAQLLSVIDLSALQVEMQVPESFARDLGIGMAGEISGNGNIWKGLVSAISPEVVNGEVAARLRFDGQTPKQLRQNQRLSVRVLLDRRDHVLTVQRGPFVDESGGSYAYVVRDGIATKTPIRVGARLQRGETARLPGVFATIGERAHHLHDFIAGYASFAKLPAPRLAAIAWAPFLEGLALHCRYRLAAAAPARPGAFDAAQIEQVQINLIKNAHESGSAPDEVTVSITEAGSELRIEVADRGPGMTDTVLAQALLPFYSTKRAGTGLGLALAREITEAHGGRVLLANRDGGGLRVSLLLPQPAMR